MSGILINNGSSISLKQDDTLYELVEDVVAPDEEITVPYDFSVDVFNAIAWVLAKKSHFSEYTFSFGKIETNCHDVIKALVKDHELIVYMKGGKLNDPHSGLLAGHVVDKQQLLQAFYEYLSANILQLDFEHKRLLHAIFIELFPALNLKFEEKSIYWSEKSQEALFVRELCKMVTRPEGVRILPRPPINISFKDLSNDFFKEIEESKKYNAEQLIILFEIWNKYCCHLEKGDLEDPRVSEGKVMLTQMIGNLDLDDVDAELSISSILKQALKIMELPAQKFNLYRNLKNYYDDLLAVKVSPKDERLLTINAFIQHLLADKNTIYYYTVKRSYTISHKKSLAVKVRDKRLTEILNKSSSLIRKENNHKRLPLHWLKLDSETATAFVECMDKPSTKISDDLKKEISSKMKEYFQNLNSQDEDLARKTIENIIVSREPLLEIAERFGISFDLLINTNEIEDFPNMSLQTILHRTYDLRLILQLIHFCNAKVGLEQVSSSFMFLKKKCGAIDVKESENIRKALFPFLIYALVGNNIQNFVSDDDKKEKLISVLEKNLEPLASWFKQSRLLTLDIINLKEKVEP